MVVIYYGVFYYFFAMDALGYTTECYNCGNTNYLRFDYDVNFDNCICMECGSVLQQMQYSNLLACSSLDQPGMEETESKTSKPPKVYKGTYHCWAYLMECLSAACFREPDINEDDKKKIKLEYELYSKRSWFHKQKQEQGLISKKDIQTILRSLNKKNNTKVFTTRYLEKWKSIKSLLGGNVKVYTPEELAKVGAKLMEYSGKWDFMQPASDKEDCVLWFFKNRKDFPSVNYILRKIHHELGIKGMDGDFPIPITGNSIKQLNQYLKKMHPEDETPMVQTSMDNFVKKI